jgi:glycosyltransferase involved in cell wall biosynthesis
LSEILHLRFISFPNYDNQSILLQFKQNLVVFIDVIIPAYNEEASIFHVIDHLPKARIRHIVVADNGSTDNTRQYALKAGAVVVVQKIKGYGIACLTALAYLEKQENKPDIVVFIDGDYSDYPEQLLLLTSPIEKDEADFVVGSRVLGNREKGALLWQQKTGNAIATFLIRVLYGYHFTDLGPFRAIRYESLKKLNMQDKNFGWTAEMQVKAAKQKLRCKEVAVNYRKRIGVSKVSGTLTGSIKAGYKILFVVFKWALR